MIPSSTYQVLAQQTDENLRRHILDQWFPRALDTAKGGFLQNFAENWSPRRETEKSVVYQARLTWLSAQAAQRYPNEKKRWSDISTHGANFLRDGLWDKQNGGFFWGVDANGSPQRSGEKHAYGVAFAIYALSANYEITRDAATLKLAQDAFKWLETHAHDAPNGGYNEALARDNRPMAPGAGRNDPVGTRYGLKSMNTHIHLLEAFAALYEIWPDPQLRTRLEEVFLLVRDKIAVSPPGALNLYFSPDWTPVPDHDSYGHDIETAFLLIEAAAALHIPDDPRTWEVARQLVDHTLDVGLDAKNGGFYDAGSVTGTISNPEKVWWVQGEALNALLVMHDRFGAQTSRYWDAFLAQWKWIQTRQIDVKNGGWYPEVRPDGTPIAGHIKSDGWTEGYHQGRAMLHVSALLQKKAKNP